MNFMYTCLLCFLIVNIKTLTAQFISMAKAGNKPNKCDDANKTTLVEHFFNVIFTEFHNSPPVCVCVQMCADQPTYCYPNGCMKKTDNSKRSPKENRHPVTNIQNDDVVNTMFMIENDFSHLLNENSDLNKNLDSERFSIKDVRPDPFKDRYKSLLKYKKMPIQLRYNLREQVKNMKSDIIKVETQDVSRTRWPKNNHKIFHEQQKIRHDKTDEPKSADADSHKFFLQGPGGGPEGVERDLYSSKFFKRDLRRNSKDDKDVQSENLTEIPDPLETKSFSLENLIENLLGNNFGDKPDGVIDIKENSNDSQAITNVNITTPENENDRSTKDGKEITCVVSLNMTNENLDENKYEESPIIKKHLDKWKNFTFNEMIAALSKRIDKQNNTSLEIMKTASKDKIEVNIAEPDNNLKQNGHFNTTQDTIIIEVNNNTELVNSTESYKEIATHERDMFKIETNQQTELLPKSS